MMSRATLSISRPVGPGRTAASDGSAAAAEAAQEAQGVLGQICRETRLYVRARLAADLLRGEIERYRQQHHGPLLARAGGLFRRSGAEGIGKGCSPG